MLLRYYHALRTGAPFVLSLLRIVAPLVLLEHGTQKMFDFPPMPRFGGFPGAAQAGGVPGGGLPAQVQAAPSATVANAGAPPASASAATTARPAASANATQTSATGNAAAAPRGPGARGPGGGGGPPYPAWLMPLAGWIETIAGGLLVIGLFSRSAAFMLSGETAVVYFIAHAPMGIYPIANGGEAAVLFAWTFLYVFFAGPGPVSVDAVWRRTRARSLATAEPRPASI